ncbi:helix-turn-helix domain-containing protein [Rhodococcoides kyotonense]|uniref:helix-turn-helix domain-containing protein n=1 Tax=Rhodococcoides kyotonense TaxID=398843 RepID=UPI00113052EE|nr:hypothetical protein [Rhodococcus kyotonensis]
MSITDLSATVGRNVRFFRTTAGASGDALARATHQFGLNWSDARISTLESGKVSPTLQTLVVVSLALSSISGTEISVADLVRTEDMIDINDRLIMTGDVLAQLLEGAALETIESGEIEIKDDPNAESIAGAQRPIVADLAAVEDARHRHNSGDDRAARDLDLSPALLAMWTIKLWSSTFTEERDRRAGPLANAQKRGRVARTLKDELRQAINGDN